MIRSHPFWVVEKMVPLGVDHEGETEWAPIKVGAFFSLPEAQAYAAECGGDVLASPEVAHIEDVFPVVIPCFSTI
jgi:hypothetical protein